MGTICSVIKIFYSSEARNDARQLQRVFVRLSLIQAVLGCTDLVMCALMWVVYNWYFLILGLASITAGSMGMYAGWKWSRRWVLIFAAVLFVRYIWYFIAEYLAMQANDESRFALLPLPVIIGLFVLKTVYSIIYFSFLALFYRKLRHMDRPIIDSSDDEGGSERGNVLLATEEGGFLDDAGLSSGESSGIEDSSDDGSFDLEPENERRQSKRKPQKQSVRELMKKSYRLR